MKESVFWGELKAEVHCRKKKEKREKNKPLRVCGV
jgi:hypothetical protein